MSYRDDINAILTDADFKDQVELYKLLRSHHKAAMEAGYTDPEEAWEVVIRFMLTHHHLAKRWPQPAPADDLPSEETADA